MAALTGRRFGRPSIATRALYGLVGGAALWTLSRWIQEEAFGGKGPDRPTGSRVRDAMTSDPRSVDRSLSVADAAQLLLLEDVGSLPVVEDGRLIGMLTDRDIVVRVLAEGKDPQSTSVGEIASRHVESAAPEQDLDEALRLWPDGRYGAYLFSRVTASWASLPRRMSQRQHQPSARARSSRRFRASRTLRT